MDNFDVYTDWGSSDSNRRIIKMRMVRCERRACNNTGDKPATRVITILCAAICHLGSPCLPLRPRKQQVFYSVRNCRRYDSRVDGEEDELVRTRSYLVMYQPGQVWTGLVNQEMRSPSQFPQLPLFYYYFWAAKHTSHHRANRACKSPGPLPQVPY